MGRIAMLLPHLIIHPPTPPTISHGLCGFIGVPSTDIYMYRDLCAFIGVSTDIYMYRDLCAFIESPAQISICTGISVPSTDIYMYRDLCAFI